MKVILTQDVKKLGQKGDLKEVSDGYARNFLFPRNLAVEATATRIKEMDERKTSEGRRKEREEEQARAIKAKLDGKTINVKAKMGKDGKLYGAVTAQEISDAIKAQAGIDLDKRKVDLKENIKHEGEYPVKLKIYQGVVAEITVAVAG
ncbi:MAG: 50S ribosomal protein L9 [Methylocystaceae bacterium]